MNESSLTRSELEHLRTPRPAVTPLLSLAVATVFVCLFHSAISVAADSTADGSVDPQQHETAPPPTAVQPSSAATEQEVMQWVDPALAESLAPLRPPPIKPNLVKIYTIANPPDLLTPWQKLGTQKYVGSGVIIEGHRILTNAHLVADQVSIEVKRQGMTSRYEAKVAFVGHECDLALLEVPEPGFFPDKPALALGTLPKLQDAVDVYGFPIGGESISITSGIVSRIEMGVYTHSQHELLIGQIDAALNPGNSGGPVIADGKIMGIALQTLDGGENVGYMIPAPVVQHFLDDVADGHFDGFPSLGVWWQPVENRSLRRALGLESGETGALITKINAGSSADGVLAVGDVLLSIDSSDVAEDLTISLGELGRTSVTYAVQRHQVGDEIELEIARGQRRIRQTVVLDNAEILVPGPSYDRQPSYLIFAGVVFQPLSSQYLEALYDWSYDLPYYAYSQYLRTPERKQIILISQVLAAPINRGYHDWENLIVEKVEGRRPRDMQDLAELLATADEPWMELVTEQGSRMILDLAQARNAGPGILQRYGVPADRSPDLKPQARVSE